jgi:hypothetical protein
MHRELPPRVVHGNLKIGRVKRWRKLLPDGKEPQKTHRNRSKLTSQISFRWKSAATKRKTLDQICNRKKTKLQEKKKQRGKSAAAKNKIQIKYAPERIEKPQEKKHRLKIQLQQKQNPKSMISTRKTMLQEKEAKMTQNQIINEKTRQEKEKEKKKIATSKNILTKTHHCTQKPCCESE